MGTQAKLLRVLEDQRVRRLGSKNEVQLDVRVIAATNSPLEIAMRDNRFREDLFYRLNVFPVPLPPLRDRLEDIPALVSALLADLNRKHSIKVAEATPNVLEILRTHNWPGNVRELRNVIERAAILASEGIIRPEHLPPVFHHTQGAVRPAAAASAANGNELRIPVGSTIEHAERALIELTLEHTKNNKTRAAEILGISQKTLFNKLREYGAQDGPGAI
jgi:DNA-binding NtrC family response regulator